MATAADEETPHATLQRVLDSLLPLAGDAQEPRDTLRRVVVLGDAGAGKTTLFSRAVAAAAAATAAPSSSSSGASGDDARARVPLTATTAVLRGAHTGAPELVAVYEVADCALAPVVLRHALSAAAVQHRAAAVVVVLDGARLDTLAAQLARWTRVLADHVAALPLDPAERTALVTASLLCNPHPARALCVFVFVHVFCVCLCVDARTVKEAWVSFEEAPAPKQEKQEKQEQQEKKQQERRPVPTSLTAIATGAPVDEGRGPDAATAAAALTDALQACLGVPVVLVLSKADALPSTAVPVAGGCSGAPAASLLASRRGVPAPAESAAGAAETTPAGAQALLRAAALRLGASVVFASGRTQRNVDVLLAALAAALCGTPLAARHQLYDYAATFVPAGWDSAKKLALDGADAARLAQALDAAAAAAPPEDAAVSETLATPADAPESCWSEDEFMQQFVVPSICPPTLHFHVLCLTYAVAATGTGW